MHEVASGVNEDIYGLELPVTRFLTIFLQVGLSLSHNVSRDRLLGLPVLDQLEKAEETDGAGISNGLVVVLHALV